MPFFSRGLEREGVAFSLALEEHTGGMSCSNELAPSLADFFTPNRHAKVSLPRTTCRRRIWLKPNTIRTSVFIKGRIFPPSAEETSERVDEKKLVCRATRKRSDGDFDQIGSDINWKKLPRGEKNDLLFGRQTSFAIIIYQSLAFFPQLRQHFLLLVALIRSEISTREYDQVLFISLKSGSGHSPHRLRREERGRILAREATHANFERLSLTFPARSRSSHCSFEKVSAERRRER